MKYRNVRKVQVSSFKNSSYSQFTRSCKIQSLRRMLEFNTASIVTILILKMHFKCFYSFLKKPAWMKRKSILFLKFCYPVDKSEHGQQADFIN